MTQVIAIANQKGGVGKTTTTMNLGCALSRAGKKVLLIDLDPQGNLSSYLGYNFEEGNTIGELMLSSVQGVNMDIKSAIQRSADNEIDYIPANINLANADFFLSSALSRETVLKRIISEITGYDYILIDCLPSLGILLMNALTASNGIIIPVQTHKFAFDGLDSLVSLISQIKATVNPSLEIIGVLPTMVENQTNMSKNMLVKLNEKFVDKCFSNHISKSIEAAKSAENCKYISVSKKIGEQYQQVAEEILARCN